MYQLWSEVSGYMSQGGFVMGPLALLTVVLWYALGYRMVMLKRGSSDEVRMLVRRYERAAPEETRGFVDSAAVTALRVARQHGADVRRVLDHELAPFEEMIQRYRPLARTIVLVAPLAGLLGTVSGMIEMFDSLADQTFFSQSGGVANGISQALITTQLGLAIAIPGMIVGRLLDKREDRIRAEIDQIKDYVIGRYGEGMQT